MSWVQCFQAAAVEGQILQARADIAAAGAARISHGPFPWKLAMKALKEAAEAALRL